MELTREQWLEAGWAFANCVESRQPFWAAESSGVHLNKRAIELIHCEAERLAAGGEPVETTDLTDAAGAAQKES